MEESTGTATSTPSEAVTSTASANSLPSETLNYQPAPSHVDMYSNNPGHIEEMAPAERTIPLPELKNMLRQQLEYYFSRENLSTDAYLNSQMDADNYVPIATVAKFNQIRRLTEDLSLVVEALRESAVVQVDEAGEKVRPNPRSGVLILREIPESTPLKDLEELFSSENCPKFSRCEFAHNNSWYVLFDTDEDTQKAYRYLREEAKTFNGKPIMARIKAKAITSAPFTTSYKNGVGNVPEADSYNTQNVNQQQQQQQNPVQYTYTNVPNEGYNSQQVCPPFYPPTMLQTWAPTTPACVDLGTVLSVNGLSPQAAFRPLSSNANRHNYSSRDRPVKAYTPQNYNFSRNEQNRYFNRGQSTSYLQRQQLHQQPSFHNLVNTNSCGFEYMPYASRSRNMTNFGMDMNFFTAPNLYYSKLPQIYQTHASQARHNPVLVPRSQVGLGAINNQDQSYLSVGNNATVLPFSKDSVVNSSTGVSSKQADSQVKENWGPNQRQRGNKRWWKENGTSSTSKSFPENSNGTSNKSVGEGETKPESPKFDLETSSFPPLPGCMEPDSIEIDPYINNSSRLSDIVKGTVKPTTRDTKTQTESATKDSSTITVKEAGPSDGAFTPPVSPDLLKETVSSSTEPLNVDSCQEPDDWEDFVDTNNDSSLCNTSINANSVVPEVPVAFNSSSSAPFNSVSSNSVMNGSVATTTTETVTSTPVVSEPEIVTNVPSEVVESKQTTVTKLPKAKQLDSLPKSRPCDLPSPKNKTPDASSSSKNKFDAFKDRPPNAPKHRTSFSNSKNNESSSKERVNDMPANSKTDHVSKNSDAFPAKEKPNQGHNKSRVLDSCSNKSKSIDNELSLLSVNGHVDSESTVSSEDEKPFRKLTYSEVAMRAKDKVEKIAQELKEKERQEAMVRQHRQQEIVAQNKQAATRGPFREFPRGRVVESRPGSKEWRERRKPARPISLPTAGQ